MVIDVTLKKKNDIIQIGHLKKQEFWEHLCSSKECPTNFVLQKRWFYNPKKQRYMKCNRGLTQSSYQRQEN